MSQPTPVAAPRRERQNREFEWAKKQAAAGDEHYANLLAIARETWPRAWKANPARAYDLAVIAHEAKWKETK